MSLGSDFAQAFAKLREAGYPEKLIAAAVEAVRPKDSALASGRLEPPPLLRAPPPNLRKLDAAGIDLYTLDDFLSDAQCARIAALSDHHLWPSSVSHDDGDRDYRTSKTCLLARLESPLAKEVDEQICRTLGIRPSYGEGIQVQRYEVGQQFKAHTDWFPPGTWDYMRFAAARGNRTWTFMVYLNEGMEGGATRFTEVDYAIRPKTGMALFWNNLHADGAPNPAMKHCGEVVTRGHKIIITKWFRTLGDGPVFYE